MAIGVFRSPFFFFDLDLFEKEKKERTNRHRHRPLSPLPRFINSPLPFPFCYKEPI